MVAQPPVGCSCAQGITPSVSIKDEDLPTSQRFLPSQEGLCALEPFTWVWWQQCQRTNHNILLEDKWWNTASACSLIKVLYVYTAKFMTAQIWQFSCRSLTSLGSNSQAWAIQIQHPFSVTNNNNTTCVHTFYFSHHLSPGADISSIRDFCISHIPKRRNVRCFQPKQINRRRWNTCAASVKHHR